MMKVFLNFDIDSVKVVLVYIFLEEDMMIISKETNGNERESRYFYVFVFDSQSDGFPYGGFDSVKGERNRIMNGFEGD